MDDSDFLDQGAVTEVVEGFLWEELDDGCVLYQEATGKMVTLNGVAEAVLSCCGGGAPVAAVVRRAAEELAISGEDAAAALRLLRQEGVLRLVLAS